MTESRKRAGRKPKSPDAVPDARLTILIHPDLLADVDRAARISHMDRSNFVRQALVDHLRIFEAGWAAEKERTPEA